MFSATHYLLRTKTDGSYLAAQPHPDRAARYLLLFREYAEALSYLNAHGPERAGEFGVESVSGSQLRGVLERWGFAGVGLVEDPWLPRVEFLART